MEETKSFSELLNETNLMPQHFSVGEKINTTIVKITAEWIFLDLGAKSEGYLDKKELMDEEGNLTAKEGDSITAYFVSSRHGEKLFTTKLLTSKSVDDFLFKAYETQIPMEATVEKEIKGGFSVKINANVSGFCPYSQMDTKKIDDVAAYVGKKFEFVVAEYSENGRNIILSRRPLLEKIEQEKKGALKESLKKGMSVSGVVASVQKFGAFIDLGGIQALLPVSEMGWSRVEDPKVLYSPGDKVEAVIINLDWESNRITLSAKATLPNPWEEVVRKYAEGSMLKGKVSNLTNFGAFITIEAGVEGLLHISKLARGKKIKHAGDVLKAGEEIEVKIEKIDRENKKISLDLAGSDKDTSATGDEDDFRNYIAKSPKAMGTLGDMFNKKSGKK
ncbi:MAG: 30S ribosomal protein S1 [Deltaproteobacteria bacterium HGW-Deltaproteobacteria-10]|jgi:small subunit ribosomal protein S1|nr:MAG: 30S ribosomal protein S1 [Deltaproteobacteria bacterium HGW-Deltaproteobacteria-2]PKN70585.1 MAG: 30S ribosomal protein S1 [Deltaproteobacteria bacterium HGW-Deltaproteobacteria-10]